MMAAIATGAIAERTHTDTYIFYSFLNSGFIFPLGLAWCWNDGWLTNLGFLDYGGASIVHLMGGMSGFIGTYLIGPRIGLYKPDEKMAYILKDEALGDMEACTAMEDYIERKQQLAKQKDFKDTHEFKIDQSLYRSSIKTPQISASNTSPDFSTFMSNFGDQVKSPINLTMTPKQTPRQTPSRLK
jgi:hypothetical protein